MAQFTNLETLKYLLYDVHDVTSLLNYSRFSDFDKASFDILLDSTLDWSALRFYPTYREMDERPAYYADGRVHTHELLKTIFKEAGENGYLGMYMDAQHGGIQLPYTISNAVNHIMEAANNHIPGYLGLTTGAANLIATFGDQALRDAFLPHMLSGRWGGTMALTEPACGSSLSDITTSATPTDQTGVYHITGQKIFISGGDHGGVENIIHLTLARIPGGPAGTKGISLFVVPRYISQPDGELVDNHVLPVADFQKMGQRGYSTVHLVYGETGPCQGWLVGSTHQGLKYMFQMMNGARIDVGMTAASTAMAAYYASLQYARERKQGKRIGALSTDEDQTLIIHHPDVRRMLLSQKAIVEGSLSLLVECSILHDISHADDDEQARHDAHHLLELLTPMAKAYPSELCRDAINDGLQIFGGYGYCMDFPLQQYMRDIRIMSIYEGTTGIQGLDLLGRKVWAENGRSLQLLSQRIMDTISTANTIPALEIYASQLSDNIATWQKCHMHLAKYAQQNDQLKLLADATTYLMMTSNIVIAYQWLKMAVISSHAIANRNNVLFNQSKVDTMKFFFKYELNKTKFYHDTLMSGDHITIEMDDTSFEF
jgi:alkylation response protein AidB-like acyl-CoA dehydrogenase